ncbi:MAG: OmpA family protein [Sulfuricurvum sp.]
MKKIAYMSAVLALLVFSGCSSKEPAIDATANGAGSTTPTASSTASESGTGDASAVISPITNASSADTSTANSANASTNGQDITSILFDYDKFDIREDMQAALTTNSGLLKGKTFKLEGNCDEFGSDEYNFALGLKRANTVKTALVNEGISADSIAMVSLGEGNPVCTEKTPECWAKNRRVDFKLP